METAEVKLRRRRTSRPQRWVDAAGDAAEALSALEDALTQFDEAMSELRSIQEEYEEWKDNMPENLSSSTFGEKLEEVCGLDLESAADSVRSAIEEARDVVDNVESAELPRGFGKD